MAPFWEAKSNEILLKVDPKRHQISDRFWGRYLVDLGSDFGRQDEPKKGPRGRQDRQDSPKRPPIRPKRPPRWPQEGSKRGLGSSKSCPWAPQRPQGEPLGAQMGPKRRQEGPKRAPRWPKRAPKEAWKAKNVKSKNVEKLVAFIGFWPPGLPKMEPFGWLPGDFGTTWGG